LAKAGCRALLARRPVIRCFSIRNWLYPHDVGTWKPGEAKALRTLDTPSLLGLRQSEPYLHDGRARTLEDIFTRHNPRDRHGTTSRLTAEDVRGDTRRTPPPPGEAPPEPPPDEPREPGARRPHDPDRPPHAGPA